MNVRRLEYYDGLRTIFCFIVLFSHIRLAFFPNSKIFFWNDGNLAVMYFLVLSGGVIVLSSPYKSNKFKLFQITSFALKRYFRLLPIVALSIIFSFLIQILGGYFNQIVAEELNNGSLSNYYNKYIPFSTAIWDAFVGSFYHRPELNTPLWTIKYEFLCVIIVYIIESIIPKRIKITTYLILLILVCLCTHDIYCIAVLVGGLLFNILFSFNRRNDINKIYKLVLVFTMIIFMGFIVCEFHSTYFRLLIICAFCVLISAHDKTQKILSNKWLVKFSKYTFAIYAIHWPIICSLTCFLYYHTITVLRPFIFLASFIIILGVAFILDMLSRMFYRVFAT